MITVLKVSGLFMMMYAVGVGSTTFMIFLAGLLIYGFTTMLSAYSDGYDQAYKDVQEQLVRVKSE